MEKVAPVERTEAKAWRREGDQGREATQAMNQTKAPSLGDKQ